MLTRKNVVNLYGGLLMGILALGMVAIGARTFLHRVDVSTEENRTLAKLPGWPHSAAEWKDFPKKFDTSFSDNFGYRNILIKINFKLSRLLLGVSSTNHVVFGLNDWLFYAGENSLLLYQNDAPLSGADLDALSQEIRYRQSWLAAMGITYRYVIAPDKHTIYPEQMPRRLLRKNKPSQYTQVMTMAAKKNLQIVDLRGALFAAKPYGRLYFRDDTHWNEFGAFVAYRKILQTLPEHFGIIPIALASTDFVLRERTNGDLAKMSELHRNETAPVLRQGRLPCASAISSTIEDRAGAVRRFTCPGAKGPKLLIFHDSFGSALKPYFASQFREVVTMWMRPTKSEFEKIVAAERPDILIEEQVERNIANAP